MEILIARTIIIFIFVIFSLKTCYGASSISYYTKNIRGIYIDIIQINLNDDNIHITPAVPSGFSDKKGYYPVQSFRRFIKQYMPSAAINGTYFDTVTYKPVGTIVIKGKLVNNGCIGIAVCIDEDNQVTFHHINGKSGSKIDWSPFSGALCSGPSLIAEGKLELYPRDEGYKDPSIYKNNRRSAIGITGYNKLLLVTIKQSVSLRSLAYVLKELGCVYAVNLDGGGSSALYYKGKYITSTSRTLSNVILVYEK